MGRYLLSGDSHADVNHLKAMTAAMGKFGCDKAFILGDCGFWPNDKGGMKFLNAIAKLDYPVYFLDGNHEDISILEQHLESPTYNDEGFIEVSENLFWAYRGFRWSWDGVRFGAVGGAYSIDRSRRVKFISWFPNEVITKDQCLKILDDAAYSKMIEGKDDRVDVMLSHDSPKDVDLVMEFAAQNPDGFWLELETENNRSKLQRICDAWRPRAVFHGHYHINYTQHIAVPEKDYTMTVRGLNCNQTKGWAYVLDTEDYK